MLICFVFQICQLKDVDKPATINVRVKAWFETIMTYNRAVQISWTGKAGICDGNFCLQKYLFIKCLLSQFFYISQTVIRTKHAFCDLREIQQLMLRTAQYKSGMLVAEKDVRAAMHDFFRRASTRKGRQAGI